MPSAIQQRKLDKLNAKLQATETRAREAERVAELAKTDARDTLNHMIIYESVSLPSLSSFTHAQSLKGSPTNPSSYKLIKNQFSQPLWLFS